MSGLTVVPASVDLGALPSKVQPIPYSWSKDDMAKVVDAVIRRGDSPATKVAYEYDLLLFFRWLADEGLTPASADPDDLDRYREWLLQPQAGRSPMSYSVASVRRKLTPVRNLYLAADRRRLTHLNPPGWLRNPRGSNQAVGPALSLSQARELREQIELDLDKPLRRLIALRDRAMLCAVMIGGGPRRSEVASIRVSDLKQTQGHWVIEITGKGNKTRSVKIAPERLRWITAWLDEANLAGQDPMFVQIAKSGRITARARILRGVDGSAVRDVNGVPAQNPWLPAKRALDGRAIDAVVRRRLASIRVAGFGAHSMRRTAGSLAHKGGANLDQIAAMLGHASIETTKRYIGQDDYLDHNAADYINGI